MHTTITPLKDKHWFRRPIGKDEIVWMSVAFAWCLIMFFMMPYWHFYGEQNNTGESYRVNIEEFAAKAEAFAEKYTVRYETEYDIPVVHPPAGADIYMAARQYDFGYILELEKDQTYRFHLSSVDVNHGFSIQPINLNLQIVPGYDYVNTITPDTAGEFYIVCNEFCGIAHHEMITKIYVVDKGGK